MPARVLTGPFQLCLDGARRVATGTLVGGGVHAGGIRCDYTVGWELRKLTDRRSLHIGSKKERLQRQLEHLPRIKRLTITPQFAAPHIVKLYGIDHLCVLTFD